VAEVLVLRPQVVLISKFKDQDRDHLFCYNALWCAEKRRNCRK